MTPAIAPVARGNAPPAVVFRQAAEGDGHAIAELQDAANEGQLSRGAWNVPGRDWRAVGAEQIEAGLTEMALGGTIVALVGGTVAGMLNFAANDHPPAIEDPVERPFSALRRALGPCLYLRAMAVRPEHRGLGIASQLLDLAASAARNAGAPGVGVIVHETNDRLLEHYRRRGYVEVAREPVLEHVAYAPGSALVALRLTLDERGS